MVEVGLGSASDTAILAAADADGRVIVSSDTDFGALLARQDRASPSFVLVRHTNRLTPDAQADLRIAALDRAETELDAGAIVTIARGAHSWTDPAVRGRPKESRETEDQLRTGP